MNQNQNVENKESQPFVQSTIKKKRGRPKKYNKVSTLLNLNIEKDLILFIPFISKIEEEEDNTFTKKIKLMIDRKEKSDEEFIDDLNDIDELKKILKDQIVINNRYSEQHKNLKIYSTKIKSSVINCPFECNKDNTIKIPEYTELCCFHDSCKIKGKPIFLPDRKEGECFYIIGWFCSVNCAIAYNFNLNDNKINQRLSLLKQLYKVPDSIKPAPNNKILKKYGGSLTVKQYRDLFYDTFNSYNIVIYPIKCLNFYIEKT